MDASVKLDFSEMRSVPRNHSLSTELGLTIVYTAAMTHRHRPKRQIPVVVSELENYKVAIAALQETTVMAN